MIHVSELSKLVSWRVILMPKYFMQNKTLVILFGVSVDDTNYNHGISFYGDENVMNLTLTKQNNMLNKNQAKLKAISELKDNWDGYGATTFTRSLIQSLSEFLQKLYKQPEIFPTADGTIQMEYEKENGDYLEFQFSDRSTCEVYMSKNKNENYFSIDRNPEQFNKLINNFYERTF